MFCMGAGPRQRTLNQDNEEDAAVFEETFLTLLDQLREAHDGQVQGLRTEVKLLREEVTRLKSDSGTIGIGAAGESIQISGATGPYADVINGCYLPATDGRDGGQWHKGGSADLDVWVCRFGSGNWAVTSTMRKDKGDPGGWMISVDADKYHPTQASCWEVNAGSFWEKQLTVRVSFEGKSDGALQATKSKYRRPSVRARGLPAVSADLPTKTDVHNGEADADDMEDENGIARRESQGSQATAALRKKGKKGKKGYKGAFEGGEDRGLRYIVTSTYFEIFFVCVILVNAMIMAFQVQYTGMDLAVQLQQSGISAAESWPGAQSIFIGGDFICGLLFALEVCLKITGLRVDFFRDYWNVFEFTLSTIWVINATGMDIGVNTGVMRLLRLAKVARLASLVKALDQCESLYVMTTSLKGSLPTLGWIVILLFLAQLMFALALFQVLREFYFPNDSYPLHERQEIYYYFGTFSRSMFTMFELMLANWPPVARKMSEYITEYFALAAILYKLSMGFSVIGVVNGVLMQETFKVVAMDDTIMVRQKEMAVNAHRKKMTKLFEVADVDGEGGLDISEFRAVLSTPEIQTWLSSMEIDTQDIDFLYKACDNTHRGRIVVEDLIRGVSKVKGFARNIDMLKFMQEFRAWKAELKGYLGFNI